MTRTLAATVEGSGPAVLLLHGQPGSAGDWAGVRERLREHFRTVTPDRPGYGSTGGRALGLVDNARAMVELLDELAVDRAIVAGHSWGAGVALAMAEAHPERVTRLVLVCPVTPSDRIGCFDRLLADPRVGEQVARAGFWVAGLALSARPLQAQLGRLLPGFGADSAAELARQWRRGALWRSFHSEQRALLSELPTLGEGLAGLTLPITVVLGTHDHVTDPGAARAFAGTAGARVIEIPRVGHMLPMQAPAALASAIAQA